MGRKHYSKEFPVLSSGDLTTTLTTAVSEVSGLDRILYIVKWASTGINGVLSVEISDDKENWETLDFGTVIPCNVDNDGHQLLLTEVTFRFVRLRYVPTAGTGTMDIAYRGASTGA